MITMYKNPWKNRIYHNQKEKECESQNDCKYQSKCIKCNNLYVPHTTIKLLKYVVNVKSRFFILKIVEKKYISLC